jgi:hypothetical protein
MRLKKRCCLISSTPSFPEPNRLSGFTWSSLKMISAAASEMKFGT